MSNRTTAVVGCVALALLAFVGAGCSSQASATPDEQAAFSKRTGIKPPPADAMKIPPGKTGFVGKPMSTPVGNAAPPSSAPPGAGTSGGG